MTRTVQYDIPEYLVKREAAKATDRTIQAVALAAAVVCVVIASLFVTRLDEMRKEAQLTLDPETTRGLPPDMALMTKTGTFRALAIDFAFIRAEQLKEQDKYYELDKLSTLICKLAPRFPTVWSYCAWNQSYNISVTQYTAEGRWYWVRNGINLIRKQGIPYNPKSIGLYRELAWIFWHKVGDFLDDFHWYYKKELAVEVERVVGAPIIALEDAEVIESFRQIAQAPQDLEELLRRDQEVADFVQTLAGVGLAPDDQLLEFVARHLRNRVQIDEVLAPLGEDFERSAFEARVELLNAPQWRPARDRLLACQRRIALKERFNMDADWMLKLMEDYGPIDWRTPYMHALYWATLGDIVTKGQLNLDQNDSMNVVRYIFFALEQSIKRGKLVLEPDFDSAGDSFIELLPDPRFIPYLHQAYLTLGEEQFGDDPRFIPGTSGPNYMNAHFTYLADWVRMLYFEGGQKNLERAKDYYAYLRQYNRNDDGSVRKDYVQPLEQFVFQSFHEDLGGFRSANVTIGALIARSVKQLAIGEIDASVASMELARYGWMYYAKIKGIDPGLTERRSLPPLSEMRVDAVVNILSSPEVLVIHKVRIWQGLDLATRQQTYDRLLPYFTELAARHQPPMSLDKAFPAPPGIDEYRRRHPYDKPDEDISRGEKAF